ncbi:chaperonin 10-like protein [Lineolata rhizophorae]|uniref:Chaperonin 10-like protein n=1 Tax=Lineolata rhizophorae TaxID=578093 RepID=A0A6A6NTC2_9PEZI|nr:chaperonin 10-like protein [Lineolata rhizophorae]
MAASQAAYKAEQAIGHDSNAATAQDVTNPANEGGKFGETGETMKALAWMGKGKVQVITAPKPKILEPTDVIIRVTGSTVCGSDLHLLHGAVLELSKGDILGHEFMGEVDSVGSSVTNLAPGDRAVASFQIACGQCAMCAAKLSSQCTRTNASTLEKALYGGRTAGMFGYSHLTGGFAGGQAEYVRVPFGAVNLLKVPRGVPDEKALYLSDVLATSWHCVVDTGVRKGSGVAIWGAGPIGEMCVQFSRLLGAGKVVVIDQNWRLDSIKEKYPGVETIDFSKLPRGTSVVQKLKEMFPGGELVTGELGDAEGAGPGPDVALECVAGEYPKGWAHYFEMMLGMETDSSEIVNEMIESVRSFGRCGITGVYVGYTNHFNIGSLMERGVRLIGNGQAPVQLYWEKLLKMVQSGEIDPLKMVSHRVRLEDLETVYDKFEHRADGMQKVFVETRFSDPPCPGAPQLTKFE